MPLFLHNALTPIVTGISKADDSKDALRLLGLELVWLSQPHQGLTANQARSERPSDREKASSPTAHTTNCQGHAASMY